MYVPDLHAEHFVALLLTTLLSASISVIEPALHVKLHL
jgi:hypothetical protein